MKTESGNLRTRYERTGEEYENRIIELDEELTSKTNELEVKTRNLKVRLSLMESENGQHKLDISDLQKQLQDEKDKNKAMLSKYENQTGKVKQDLEYRLQTLLDTEKLLRDSNEALKKDKYDLLNQIEGFRAKIEMKEKELIDKDKETKSMEGKTKQKIEKTWLEKLKRSEENAASDVSLFIYK